MTMSTSRRKRNILKPYVFGDLLVMHAKLTKQPDSNLFVSVNGNPLPRPILGAFLESKNELLLVGHPNGVDTLDKAMVTVADEAGHNIVSATKRSLRPLSEADMRTMSLRARYRIYRALLQKASQLFPKQYAGSWQSLASSIAIRDAFVLRRSDHLVYVRLPWLNSESVDEMPVHIQVVLKDGTRVPATGRAQLGQGWLHAMITMPEDRGDESLILVSVADQAQCIPITLSQTKRFVDETSFKQAIVEGMEENLDVLNRFIDRAAFLPQVPATPYTHAGAPAVAGVNRAIQLVTEPTIKRKDDIDTANSTSIRQLTPTTTADMTSNVQRLFDALFQDLNKGKPDEVLKTLARIHGDIAAMHDFRALRGAALLDLGKTADAAEILWQVWRQAAPPRAWWLLRLGMACNSLKRWDEAVRVYRQLERDFPNEYPVWVSHGLGIALLYSAADKTIFEEGISYLQQAIRLDARFPWSRIGLGIAHRLRGEYDSAIAVLRSALKLAPAEAALELAKVCQARGEVDEARKTLKTVIDSGVKQGRLFDSLAQIEIGDSQWSSAAKLWAEAIAATSDEADRSIYEVKRLRAELEAASAIANWEQASRVLECWLTNPSALKSIENLLDDSLDAESSHTDFDSANWVARCTRDVLRVIRHLHERQPANPTVSRLRGEVARRLGRRKEAREALGSILVSDLSAWAERPTPRKLARILRIAAAFDAEELAELPPDLIARCCTAGDASPDGEKTEQLLQFIIRHNSVSALNAAGNSIGPWLLRFLRKALLRAAGLQDWDDVLDWLKILDETQSSDILPDWLAVEIIGLSIRLAGLAENGLVEEERTSARESLEDLQRLRLWRAVNEFDRNFPLLDDDWLRTQFQQKRRQIGKVDSLSGFLALKDSHKLSPHILFDVAWYVKANNLHDNKTHPLIHFFRHSSGYTEVSACPNPFFDCDWYRDQYLSGDQGTHPLLHYLKHFNDTGIQPCELFRSEYVTETQALLPDEDPLAFYLEQLASGGRDFRLRGFSPWPLFDRAHYLSANADLMPLAEEHNLDPFGHFVLHGYREGRSAHPLQRYNQFVNHELLHLEPFNLNSPVDENWFQHLKASKAKAAYFEGQKVLAQRLEYRPRISIIVPVFQVKPRYLVEMIESVLAQTYENWQLCLVDDASVRYRNEILSILKDYAARDERIQFRLRQENGHICATSNDCLAIADGEFVALLDHDDLLTPDALYECAAALNERPDLDILYSDEDKVDAWGVFSDPYYKPDWSPHSLWSRMYACHLTVYRRKLVDEVGGFHVGFEGSQDHDLLLRCSARTTRIHHIQRVSYHWRIHPESTAGGGEAKPYAAEAGVKAVRAAVAARGIAADISSSLENSSTFWVRPKVNDHPLVEVIIPSRNGTKILSRCLNSIFEMTTYDKFRVTVIDNGSTEEEFFELMERWSHAEPNRFRTLRDDRPFNYAALNNAAVNVSEGEFLLFLNNDTEVISESWIEDMLGYAQLEEVGAVGAKLYYPDGSIQHAGAVTGLGIASHVMKSFPGNAPGYFRNLELVTNYSVVTAACMMVSKVKFQAVNGFEDYLSVAFNDVDFCLKLRKSGYYNVYLPFVELYHHESKSRGFDDKPFKLERLQREESFMRQAWGKSLNCDPFYSPWLTISDVTMGYRFH